MSGFTGSTGSALLAALSFSLVSSIDLGNPALAHSSPILSEPGTLQNGGEGGLYEIYSLNHMHDSSASGSIDPPTTTAGSPTTTARSGFELYNFRNLYTIEYPTGWVIDTSGFTGTGLTIWNRQPPRLGGGDWPTNLVRTNIDIIDDSFNSVVRGFEQSDFDEITRRGEITIGGRRALRLWTESVESDAIYTIVEYSSSQTAVIGSFYIGNNWVEDIQDVHWSFRKLN